MSAHPSATLRVKSAIDASLRTVLLVPLQLLDALAAGYSALLDSVRPGWALYWIERQGSRIAARSARVEHQCATGPVTLSLFTPNALCQYRADSFSTKEPETLAWIDQYGGKGALFDIGANVGLYSIYYATTKPGNVYAFEPSVFNLALLAKNVGANGVEQKVRIVANPLSASTGFAEFTLQSTNEGGALSSFGVSYGQDGKPLAGVLSYQVVGFTLDHLVETGIVTECPSLVKLDVDGIEHLILRGATKTISDPRCRSILVEVNDELVELAREVHEILTGAGFVRDEGHHAGDVASAPRGLTSNQIWVKR